MARSKTSGERSGKASHSHLSSGAHVPMTNRFLRIAGEERRNIGNGDDDGTETNQEWRRTPLAVTIEENED